MITRGDDMAGAMFSDDDRYRYLLWRYWDRSLPRALWILLNPSTADESKLDPTLRRVHSFTRNWGYGSFVIGNLFALRSTDPAALLATDDPVGPDNDGMLLMTHRRDSITICAWGAHRLAPDRANRVSQILLSQDAKLHCLGRTKCGHPRHPLYLAGNTQLSEYVPGQA